MTFEEILDAVKKLLESRQRLTYRALKRIISSAKILVYSIDKDMNNE